MLFCFSRLFLTSNNPTRIATKFINGFFLNQNVQIAMVQRLSLAILGGRATFSNVEFLSSNLHIKCLEFTIVFKWYLGSKDVRTPKPGKQQGGECNVEFTFPQARLRRSSRFACRCTSPVWKWQCTTTPMCTGTSWSRTCWKRCTGEKDVIDCRIRIHFPKTRVRHAPPRLGCGQREREEFKS